MVMLSLCSCEMRYFADFYYALLTRNLLENTYIKLREIHYICIHVVQPFVQLEHALYGLCTAVLGTFLRRDHFTRIYY